MTVINRQNHNQGEPEPMIEGVVPLLPVQSCFFERRFSEPHHWNASVMIYSREVLNSAILRKVFTKIVEHHDALRMVFREKDGNIIQYNRGLEGELFDFKVLDFTNLSDPSPAIEIEAEKIQRSINLETGPLVKIGLFMTNNGSHLLITVHHLVVDGESLRIIMEDLLTGYLQSLKGETIQFKNKTGLFRDWAVQLHNYGRSEKVLPELDYWRNIEATEITLLPKDNLVNDHRFKFSRIISAALPENETRRLLKKIPLDLTVQEILLVAFGLALKDWTGENKALIRLIGNGRNMKLNGIDLSRTVGWLSISYPVILDMGYSDNLARQLQYTRDSLRNIPGNGAGYDILRFITLPLNGAMSELKVMPEIIFNFLGIMGNNLVAESMIPKGFIKSPESLKEYTLDFTVGVLAGKLQISLDYNRLEYHESTMLGLTELYFENLKQIMAVELGK